MILPFSQYRTLLFTYVKPHRGQMLLLLFLLLSGIGLQLLNPLLLSSFIDGALAKYPLAALLRITLFFIVVALGGQVIAVLEGYIAGRIAWATTNALRSDVALHCLHLDMDFHHAHTPGEMIERIDGDVSMLNEFFSRFVISVLANALFLCGVIVVIWRIDWRIALALAAYALGTLAIMLYLRRFGISPWISARQASADLFGFLEERLSGTEEIRASGASAYMLARLYPLLRQRFQTKRHALTISMLLVQATKLLFTGGTALAFALGAYYAKAGVLSIGTVYLLFNYVEQLVQPLMQISRNLDNFQQAAASLARVLTLLQLQPLVKDGTGMQLTANVGKALGIVFQDVSFGYRIDEPVLKDISFSITPGEILGVLGRTGSGKTTLTKLLFRLYDPQHGTIRLLQYPHTDHSAMVPPSAPLDEGNDTQRYPQRAGAAVPEGIDIRTERLSNVRQRIGLVTQHVQLFHASIRDNVTLFDDSISDESILAALRQLGLWEWYQSLPQGLDTMLAASGDGLSAGEAQLLALTRVFLRQPAIIVLDEATARIDPATEALIEQAIDRLLHKRTAIIIAHRLSTVRRADTLLILEDGRIREQGTRAALQQDPTSRFSHLLHTGQEGIV